MRTGHLLFSAVQFLFVVLVLFIGVLFLGLEYVPGLRHSVGTFFSQTTTWFGGIGYLVIGCGILLLMGFCAMYKGPYLRLHLERGQTAIDPALIRQLVAAPCQQCLGSALHDLSLRVNRKQNVEITIELSKGAPLPEQESVQQLESALGTLFATQLGYSRPFFVSFVTR